jgi:hypothetical protein
MYDTATRLRLYVLEGKCYRLVYLCYLVYQELQ